jgi:hypothetical protein
MPERMADPRAPVGLDLPDLSHLTEEERRIIENVMLRQRQEEEKENEIMRYKHPGPASTLTPPSDAPSTPRLVLEKTGLLRFFVRVRICPLCARVP